MSKRIPEDPEFTKEEKAKIARFLESDDGQDLLSKAINRLVRLGGLRGIGRLL